VQKNFFGATRRFRPPKPDLMAIYAPEDT